MIESDIVTPDTRHKMRETSVVYQYHYLCGFVAMLNMQRTWVTGVELGVICSKKCMQTDTDQTFSLEQPLPTPRNS